MTEIPEHLLKRSKERRAAIGGEDAPAEDAPAGAAVEPAAAASPEVAAPAVVPEPVVEPPKPVRPEVAAALSRRKIPVWALPVLAFLPLWAYVYQATLEPPPKPDDTPIALGQAAYSSSCASCHGAAGQGISGPALTGVLETWTDYRDHSMWVRLGSTNWPAPSYGDTDKHKNGGMPDHLSWSDAELAQVVLYERVTFGGMAPDSEEAASLTAIAEDESTFEKESLGPVSQRDGVDAASLKG